MTIDELKAHEADKAQQEGKTSLAALGFALAIMLGAAIAVMMWISSFSADSAERQQREESARQASYARSFAPR